MVAQPGRNEPCPCGSGKKYKQCCLTKASIPVISNSVSLEVKIRNALRAAAAYRHQGESGRAESVCAEILRMAPNHPDALHFLGIMALHDARVDSAIDLINRAIRKNPSNPEYFSNLGLALQFQGDLTKAEKNYRQSISIKPDYADAWYNLHAVLINPSDMNPSIQCMRKVIQFAPNDLDARFMLGVLEDYAGDSSAAQEHLELVKNGPALFRARLDAWRYMKKSCKTLPRMIGSNIDAFQIGFNAANKEGLVLEFGVRHGTSIRQIAALSKGAVHGFDSFEGLPEVWHHEPQGSYTTKGEIPKVPNNVNLHVGWFEDTLPTFLQQYTGPVRFINVDCDIYSSTKTILDQLAPRIVPGSVLVFDEYVGNEHWREDEFKAFQEAITHHGWRYEYLCFSFFTKQVAVRITKVNSNSH